VNSRLDSYVLMGTPPYNGKRCIAMGTDKFTRLLFLHASVMGVPGQCYQVFQPVIILDPVDVVDHPPLFKFAVCQLPNVAVFSHIAIRRIHNYIAIHSSRLTGLIIQINSYRVMATLIKDVHHLLAILNALASYYRLQPWLWPVSLLLLAVRHTGLPSPEANRTQPIQSHTHIASCPYYSIQTTWTARSKTSKTSRKGERR